MDGPDYTRTNDDRQVERSLSALRLFPLPKTVLLPGSLIPLHVFEPRYREMIADCRRTDRVLAIATIGTSGQQPCGTAEIQPIVGVGRLVFDQLLPDGRSIIVIKGVLRARIVEELDGDQPYRIVRAEPLVDDPADLQQPSGQLELLKHLVRRVIERLGTEGDAQDLLQVCLDENDPGWLADVVAGALINDADTRQALLEESAPLKRVDAVNAYLATSLEHLGCCGRNLN